MQIIKPRQQIVLFIMIQIGQSYQNKNGDWVTINGHVKTNLAYFFSTEHEYYNDKGEFMSWNMSSLEWITSPENKLNL